MSKQNKMATGSETSYIVSWFGEEGGKKNERVFNGPKSWMVRCAKLYSQYAEYGPNWTYEDITL